MRTAQYRSKPRAARRLGSTRYRPTPCISCPVARATGTTQAIPCPFSANSPQFALYHAGWRRIQRCRFSVLLISFGVGDESVFRIGQRARIRHSPSFSQDKIPKGSRPAPLTNLLTPISFQVESCPGWANGSTRSLEGRTAGAGKISWSTAI